MLPAWNPDNLSSKIPGVNIALCGGRRMGKSSAAAHLLWRNASRFDLVICFVGSANCNPVLQSLLERYWDTRFFFNKWKPALIDNLMTQQERLGADKRSILIILDDVVLSSKDQDQLACLAIRGRHFGISLLMACVSYTTLPKRARRSLDAVLVFSLPMKGDLKILTWEYCSNTRVAEFALNRLQEHECLVLETLSKKQKLAIWKATIFTPEDVRSAKSPGCLRSRNTVSVARASERPEGHPPQETSFESNRTRSGESQRSEMAAEEGIPTASLTPSVGSEA